MTPPPQSIAEQDRLSGPRVEPSSRRRSGWSAIVTLWAVLRLPALVLTAYLLRKPILELLDRQFDILAATRFVIDLLSTPVTRFFAGAVVFTTLLVCVAVVKRHRAVIAFLIVQGVAAAIVAIALQAAAISMRRGLFVWLICAANLIPPAWLHRPKAFSRAWNTLMVAGVGVVEIFFAREYWWWLRGRVGAASVASRSGLDVRSAIPGLLVTGVAFAVLIRSDGMLILEQKLRLSDNVRVIERGESLNWIELDPTGTYLYVTGHTLAQLRRYDLRDVTAPPLRSRVSTGGSQGFAYDADANEIYTFNTYTNELLCLDATTLEQKRLVQVRGLSPGDPWLAVDRSTGTVSIVSEADVRTGAPLLVLDRLTGRVLAQADLDAGNILKHPGKPWLYLTFFRRRSELLLYNLETRAVERRAPADPQAERMAYWHANNELLVTSPVESRIMRFDADTLQPKGYIAAPFGVRAIAVDEQRQLLFAGNLATGSLVIIDLRSNKRVKSYYLGPWLRTIQVQPATGTAYISANGALYVVNYA